MLVNQDYFTASLYPEVQMMLDLVDGRHASEPTWKLYWDGHYAEPLGDSEYALRAFPNHPRALNLLAEIAKATNQPSLPLPYFERALSLYPRHAFTHTQYGHYLIDIGAVNAGIAELKEALQLDQNQLMAQAWLAEALTPGTGIGPIAPSDSAKADGAGTGAGAPGASRGK